jgi:penicillin-binding protein 1C
MTDKPGKPSETPRPEGGWYVPGGAGEKPTPSASEPIVPLPTNTEPEMTGGWYVPPEAKPVQAAQPVTPVAPTPAPEPTEAPQPEPTPAEAPVAQEAEPVAQEEDSEQEFDYSNYVPGKGFVGAQNKDAQPEQVSEPAAEPVEASAEPDEEATNPETNTGAFQPTGVQPAIPVARLEPAAPSGVRFERLTSDAPIIPSATDAAAAAAAPSPASTGAIAPIKDKYSDVESEVQILRRKYRVGNMTADELRAALRKLMVLDDTGNWWMIGMESDRWYKYDGRNWVQADPPGHSPAVPTLTAEVPAGGMFGMPSPSSSATPPPPGSEALPRSVPLVDDQATIVGRAAPYLDPTLRNPAITEPVITSEATVASPVRSDQYVGGIPSPAPDAPPVPIQPDYGETNDPRANRGQLAGVMVRLAVLSLVLTLGCSLIVVLGAIGYYYSVINQYNQAILDLENNVQSQAQTLRIHDNAGRIIAEVSDKDAGNRTLVTLDNISPYAIHAVVSTEDQRFYTTPGFDIIGIVRAVFQNVAAGGTVSGASSITQQLARTLVFDPNDLGGNSTQRKIVEIFVASEISRRYSKSQILQMYLNQMPFGNRSNGIEAAAQGYFGKPAKDLNLPESALLAGLLQAPSAYNPVVNREAAFNRMNDVLRLMVQTDCIQMQPPAPQSNAPFCVKQTTVDQAGIQTALVKTRTYTAPVNTFKYPHFVNFVVAQLEEQYGAQNLYKLGYDVYTTLDPNLQDAAEAAVRQQVQLLRSNRVYNGAVFAINPQSGAILVMVGSANYNDTSAQVAGQYNVVLGSRQPGSSIKPIMYAGTFERNPTTGQYMTPATILWDVATEWGGYRPRNYDGRFRGPVSLRTALGSSLNIPAVRAMEFLTVGRFKDIALRLGLTFPLAQPETVGLPTALGAAEVRMYDMVRAYGVFANGGKRLDRLTAIARIVRKVNGQDQVVFDIAQTPPVQTQVLEPPVAYLMNSILSDNDARTPTFGRNSVLNLADGRPAGVKTGTTDEFKDNWTVGYTPDIVVGAWVGNSDNTPMFNVSGIQGAAPIWNQVMTAATRGKPVSQFPIPQGVAQAVVCADYGVALDDSIAAECPQTSRRNEIFIAANPPPASSDVIRTVRVDTFSGLIANESCPGYEVTRRYLTGVDTFVANWLNNTNDGRTWAANHSLPVPISPAPSAACDASTPRPNVGIENPAANQTVAGLIQIFGRVEVPNFATYQLQVAQSERPNITVNISEVTGIPRGSGSFLGSWDTTRVSDGNYILYILFTDRNGRSARASQAVVVNNTNPPPGAFQNNPGVQPTGVIPGIDPGVVQPTAAPFIEPTFTPIGPPPTRPLFPPTP